MLSSVKRIYRELPDKFWTLVGASFVDRLGGALIFPFFALYITQHFGVGMTEVGTLFAFFSVSSIIGGAIGGALADKYGRKSLIIFSLIMSAGSTVIMGLVDDIKVFYLVAILVGILADTGGPAHQAMVADMLPEEKRSTGYAVLRVTANLAVTLGPMIGGLLAGINYLYLFIIDAIMSTITAFLVFFLLPETKPESTHIEKANEPSLLDTIKGYAIVFKDKIYIAFMLISTLMVIVYIQMNSTLSVFLRDYRATPPQGFGYILSMNAAMVVLFQFWISRRLDAKRPLLVMACWIHPVCHWIWHVWVCLQLLALPGCDVYHYHRRDDDCSHVTGVGRQFCSRRYAGTLYGSLWVVLDRSIGYRTAGCGFGDG